MPMVTVDQPQHLSPEIARFYCEALEGGSILFFPRSPIVLDKGDLEFLIQQRQSGSAFHKNIAYRPQHDRLTGTEGSSAEVERLKSIMRNYSRSVAEFLSGFLQPYRSQWTLDYASFRPQAEESRDLALRKRNDLLHTDAFPTRPTRGDRILRFFNNINPTESRRWVTGGTFRDLVAQYGATSPDAGGKVAVPRASESSFVRHIGKLPLIRKIAPGLVRSPYDAFMMDFHNFLKENAGYQSTANKEYVEFPPGSSWMVFTDAVAHAVLSGQFALEQTFLVKHEVMVDPAASPLGILENLASARLT